MPSAKNEQAFSTSAAWIWQRGKGALFSAKALVNDNNDISLPKLTLSEANSVIQEMEAKGLILFNSIIGGDRVYMLNDAALAEWANIFPSIRNTQQTLPQTLSIPNQAQKEEGLDLQQLAEPHKFALGQIDRHLPHLKAAWIPVTALMVASFLGGFFLARDLLVSSKQAQIDRLQTDLSSAEKEVSRLKSQNEDQKKTVHEAGALKKRIIILSTQLAPFTERWRKSPPFDDPTYESLTREYKSRFSERCNAVVRQLDEAAIYVERLQRAVSKADEHLSSGKLDVTDVDLIAQELEKLLPTIQE
jgi:hypothetical protein